MAAPILAKILYRCQTTHGEIAVLTAICQTTDDQGRNGTIAYSELARRTGYCLRQVQNLVKALEQKHLLRVRRLRLAFARFATNVYTVVCPWQRDRGYRAALARKQAQQQAHAAAQAPERLARQQRSSCPIAMPVPQEENTKREKEKPPEFCAFLDRETLIRKLGLSPGSLAYRLALGGE